MTARRPGAPVVYPTRDPILSKGCSSTVYNGTPNISMPTVTIPVLGTLSVVQSVANPSGDAVSSPARREVSR